MFCSHLFTGLMIAGWVLAVLFAGLAHLYWRRIGDFRAEAERLQQLVKSRSRFLALAREARRGIAEAARSNDDDDPFGVEDPTVPDVRRK